MKKLHTCGLKHKVKLSPTRTTSLLSLTADTIKDHPIWTNYFKESDSRFSRMARLIYIDRSTSCEIINHQYSVPWAVRDDNFTTSDKISALCINHAHNSWTSNQISFNYNSNYNHISFICQSTRNEYTKQNHQCSLQLMGN